ncbi:MAG: redoxin domain-containing protein [Sphingobacteriales bacterium]|nr:redoxin domain-containing protein [Sphingobacteriales bacterium]
MFICLAQVAVNAQATLPDFKFQDLKGKVIGKSQVPYQQYLTVVYFDPTCEHCIELTEQIVKNIAKFKKTHLLWVSIADAEPIAEFQRTYFPNVKNMTFVRDAKMKVYDYFENLDDTPTFVVFDKNGKRISTLTLPKVEQLYTLYK